MSQQIKVVPILATTKGELKKLRRDGFVPVSVQHKGDETTHLMCEARTLNDFIAHYGESAILELKPEKGRPLRALVRTVQRDPVTRTLLQVSFQKIVRGDRVKTHIPVTVTGEPEAVVDGIAVINQPLLEVEVRCDPQDLPDHLSVDAGSLTMDTTIRVSDIRVPNGVEILTDGDRVVATLVGMTRQDEEPEAPEIEEVEATDQTGNAESGSQSERDGKTADAA